MGKAFSNLDLSHAYQQVLLDKDSRKYVTIDTHAISVQLPTLWGKFAPAVNGTEFGCFRKFAEKCDSNN